MSTNSKTSPVKNRRNTGQFPKGRSGNPNGRPSGAANKATIESKAVCTQLINDPAYRARFRARLIAGKLAPAVECMVWHYAFGKPKDNHDYRHGGRLTLAHLLTGEDPEDDD